MTDEVASSGKGEPEIVKLALPRRAMVRACEKAVRVPYFSLRASADVTALVKRRNELREAGTKVVPSINDLVLRAVALALREHPNVNASYLENEVAQYPRVNLGVAIAVPGGLVAPAVYDADLKDAETIGADVRTLVELAERRALSRDVIQDATFTVSNLGMYGIEDFDPLLNPPQAAILGVGAISSGEEQRIRLSLGCDHRVLTGAEGAVFLISVRNYLETADELSPLFGKEMK
jgi:pyruvate dehydrogenase E2 component (dihydrolipoamide acetyltransferase)